MMGDKSKHVIDLRKMSIDAVEIYGSLELKMESRKDTMDAWAFMKHRVDTRQHKDEVWNWSTKLKVESNRLH